MHNFFSGLIGLFVGLGAFFHGNSVLPIQHTQPQMLREASNSANVNLNPSGYMRSGEFGNEHLASMSGQRPFFGKVTEVNGSTITVTLVVPQFRMMHPLNPSITLTITPPVAKTINILLDDTTRYNGGTQSDIIVNTNIAGIGKLNTDGSITAETVQINPTVPTSFPTRRSEDRFPAGPMRNH